MHASSFDPTSHLTARSHYQDDDADDDPVLDLILTQQLPPYVWFPFSLLTKIWSSWRVNDRDVGKWVNANNKPGWTGWEAYDIHTEHCGSARRCIIVGIPGAALKGKDIPRSGSNVARTELDARARIAAHLAAAAKGEYAGGVVAAMADEDEDTDTDDDEEIVLEPRAPVVPDERAVRQRCDGSLGAAGAPSADAGGEAVPMASPGHVDARGREHSLGDRRRAAGEREPEPES